MKKVVIDPGHGGHDPGAISLKNKLREKDITLKIALYAQDYLLKNYEVQVKLTRSNDVFISLKDRAKIANRFNADVFVSIHVNGGTQGTGFESFIYTNTKKYTLDLQSCLHKSLMKFLNKYSKIKDRGMKKANYYVLKRTKMAAILTENLFIELDAPFLSQETFLESLGQFHALGIVNFLNLPKKSIDYK